MEPLDRELREATSVALVLLRWIAANLPPCQGAALRDCMRCVERVTGVELADD